MVLLAFLCRFADLDLVKIRLLVLGPVKMGVLVLGYCKFIPKPPLKKLLQEQLVISFADVDFVLLDGSFDGKQLHVDVELV